MRRKTRALTVSAVMAALSVVFLYLAGVLPTGNLAFSAAASLFVIAAVIEAGVIYGVAVFIVSTLLGALIVPDKTLILFYALFFGYYPIVKNYTERLKKKVPEWIIKLLVFNAALTVFRFLFTALLWRAAPVVSNLLLLYLAGNGVFIVFDIGLTRLISLYIYRISKQFRKNNS